MNRVLIVGATSAIASATARQLAEQGEQLILAGRKTERLQILAQDLEVRGAGETEVHEFDAGGSFDYLAFAERVWGDGLDMLLIAHGSLPEQSEVQDDPDATLVQLGTNADSALAMLAAFSGRFKEQGSGTIAVLSSVAGDRGRQSNYVYGAAKAALSVYTDGLRNRLAGFGVTVLTVKPGFVDSPMTAQFKKGPLWAQPEQIARGILRARGQGGGVLYLPWFWRYIMLVIRLIPDRLFRKLSL
jgi:short-subunit dehydrogenase